MSLCPHCGMPIKSSTNQPWYADNRGNTSVSLGCGTLILIAVIVAIFSGGEDNSNEIRNLQSEVRQLERKIDRLVVKLESENRQE